MSTCLVLIGQGYDFTWEMKLWVFLSVCFVVVVVLQPRQSKKKQILKEMVKRKLRRKELRQSVLITRETK